MPRQFSSSGLEFCTSKRGVGPQCAFEDCRTSAAVGLSFVAVEEAFVEIFGFAGGPVPVGRLILGKSKLHLRVQGIGWV